ncbi:MAG: cobalamin-dependent protein [Crenarchaeota archaeon]|nr:cobalamin-dependent protein [Thermoproteota archaeon]MDA1124751.1 cobalamin-dependent protein [Thermoproteota archaeon]
MVYLRKKKVKGVDYLYLVKSTWDKQKKTSRQETIKYLGQSSSVTRDDIPAEFRDDAKINSFLLQNTPKDRQMREQLIEQLRNKLFSALTEGSLKDTMDIYSAFISDNALDQFYERIMTPVMAEIGYLWSEGKLSIATEHVASNIAHSLVKVIADENRKSKKLQGKIVLTTPVGEDHNLGCNVLDSFLVSKGFITFNLSPSTPAESLIEFIKTAKPDALVVSITLEDSIKSGQRMVKKVHEAHKRLPIFIGGQAFSEKTNFKFDGELVTYLHTLEQIPRIIKKK